MSFPPGTEMFQFPGFASCDLCIQSQDTWLAPLSDCPQGRQQQSSGGLPHSEISGSKPIPGSPLLIAGYHVLHRLLLPRHPPNALLALDPIQRRTGLTRRPFVQRPSPPPRPHRRSPGRKSYIFPPHGRVRPQEHSVSVLDLEQTCLGPRHPAPPQVTPTLGRTSGSDVSLSSRLSNARPDRTGQHAQRRSSDPWWSLSGSNRRPPACKAGALPAELRPSRRPWWVEEDSNLRPHAYQACALTT